MTTKELIKRLGGFKDARSNEFVEEIVQRLRELDDLKVACREMMKSMRKSDVGRLVQILPKNHNKTGVKDEHN